MQPLLASGDWVPFPTSSRLSSASATLAQSVEQLPRKEQVDGSIPSGGSHSAEIRENQINQLRSGYQNHRNDKKDNSNGAPELFQVFRVATLHGFLSS